MTRVLILAIAAFVCLVPVEAQNGARVLPPRRGPGPIAGNPNIFERLNRMSSQQREHWLAKLPPPRREKIERGLSRYNSLSPQEREHLRNQFENFKQMPPDQQEALRRNFRMFTMLPENRRVQVRQELQQLRSMTPEERQERMDSEDFKHRFQGPERRLLENFSRLMPSDE